MKLLSQIWETLIDWSEELHTFRQQHYRNQPFDRYL